MSTILLYCEHESGMVGLPAALIAGEPVGNRTYSVADHFLVIDARQELAEHDAEAICKLDGYRMPTAKEQNHYVKSQRDASAITEEVAGG